MQHHVVDITPALEQAYGFTFIAEDVDEILSRLRTRCEAESPPQSKTEEAPVPCRYEGLHSAIKRNREWYR